MVDTFHNNWMTQLRRGLLQFCTLKTVSDGRVHGYAIVRQLSETPGLFVDEATVYRTLRKFTKHGLVRASREKSTLGPPRKCYEVTPRGREALLKLRDYWRLVKRGVDGLRA